MGKTFFVTFLFFIFPILTSAQKSDKFVRYISEKIYGDCSGVDIKIKDDSPLSFIKSNDTDNSFSFCENNCVINWPYNYNDIEFLVATAISKEPYTYYGLINGNWELADGNKQEYEFKNSQGETFKKISRDGRNILSCKDNILDITGNIYWWNKKIIEMPTIENFFTKNLSISIPIISITGITILPITIIFRKKIKKIVYKIWPFTQ